MIAVIEIIGGLPISYSLKIVWDGHIHFVMPADGLSKFDAFLFVSMDHYHTRGTRGEVADEPHELSSVRVTGEAFSGLDIHFHFDVELLIPFHHGDLFHTSLDLSPNNQIQLPVFALHC